MTTTELITTDLDAFIDAVAKLDADTCERHARAVIRHLDEPVSFEEYLWALTRVAVEFNGPDHEKTTQYYLTTEKLFPRVPAEDDILGRLAGLMLKMMAKRLEPLKGLQKRDAGGDR